MKLTLKKVATGERAFRATEIRSLVNTATRLNVYSDGKKVAMVAQHSTDARQWLCECSEGWCQTCDGTAEAAVKQMFSTNETQVEVVRG